MRRTARFQHFNFATVSLHIACVAGGMRERATGGRAAIFLSGEAREEFASGEAASEFPACHISYGFCLLPTFIAFDESIK